MVAQFDRLRERLESLFGAVAFPAVVYLASRFALIWAMSAHWILGAALMVLLGAVVGVVLVGLNETFFRKFPARVVVSLFATTVLLAASVLSAFSYVLYIKEWGHYTSSAELHPGRFADYYLWYFVDMIPGLKIWDTLAITAPVRATDPAAGVPLLLFRMAVVLPILALFRKWVDVTRKERSVTSSGEGIMPSNKPLQPTSGSDASR